MVTAQQLQAARQLSAELSEAIKVMAAENKKRHEQGHSSLTGWPVKLIKKPDDGLTIPERRALRIAPPVVQSSRIQMMLGVLADEREGDMSRPGVLEVVAILAVPLAVLAVILAGAS